MMGVESKKDISIDSFSQHLFWDVDKSDLDFTRHARFIVKKVLLYGFFEDWQLIFRLYGKNAIMDHAAHIRELDLKTAYFISTITDMPLSDFICYTMIQSHPKHWNF